MKSSALGGKLHQPDHGEGKAWSRRTHPGRHTFNKHDQRIVQIDKYRIEVIPSRYMLVTTHLDVPGVVGNLGVILGQENINIAGMQLGRQSIGGEAVMVLQIDSPVPEETLTKVRNLEGMFSVKFVQLQ